MSITNQAVVAIYNGNSSTLAFAVPGTTNSFSDNSEIVVTAVDSSGVETLKVLTTDYTLSGGTPATTVNMLSAPATGSKLMISRNSSATQSVDFIGTGPFDSEVNEAALDKLTRIAQEVKYDLRRAIKFKKGSAVVDIDLPAPTAGATIAWNDTATSLVNGASAANLSAAVDAAAAAVVSAASAASSAGSASTNASSASSSASAAAASAAAAAASASSPVDGANINAGSVPAAALAANSVTTVKIADGNVTPAKAASGFVVQVVNTMVSALITGNTVIPLDDTIPQNTEGNQYMSLSITPLSATNKLKITVVFSYGMNANSTNVFALFQDSTVNAIAAVEDTISAVSACSVVTFIHYMTAGTTSATTFKVRAGPNSSGTISFNGLAGNRAFGGVSASSITIEEIKA